MLLSGSPVPTAWAQSKPSHPAHPTTAPGRAGAAARSAPAQSAAGTSSGAPPIRPPLLTFAVLSDIHIRSGRSDWGVPYRDRAASERFAADLTDLHQRNPHLDALVLNGDLTVTGLDSDYQEFLHILHTRPHPARTLLTIGNHEFYAGFYGPSGVRRPGSFPNGVTEAACIDRFLARTGMPGVYYDTWVHGFHFIALGTERSVISDRLHGDGAYLSPSQLTWLQARLMESPPTQPTFVFLHEPLPGIGLGGAPDAVRPAEPLRAILTRHPNVVVFSGHTHRTLWVSPQAVRVRATTFVNDGAVCEPKDDNRKVVRDSEGLYVEVFPKVIRIEGRDFTHRRPICRIDVPVEQTISSPTWDTRTAGRLPGGIHWRNIITQRGTG